MTPIVNGLMAGYTDQLTLIQLDANERSNAAYQQRVGVRGHPSLVLIDADGTVAARFLGPQTEEQLSAAIDTMLNAE